MKKVLKSRETWVTFVLIVLLGLLAFVPGNAQIDTTKPEKEFVEDWPHDGDVDGWIGEEPEEFAPRKETYLVGFVYYRGYTPREIGSALVRTDAFMYSLPQGEQDDRLLNDLLSVLYKQGVRLDLTRRGAWLAITSFDKVVGRPIFDTRNVKKTVRE